LLGNLLSYPAGMMRLDPDLVVELITWMGRLRLLATYGQARGG
jgi:hypothetical protein